MNNFSELGLPEELLRALDKMKFSTPTPIQAQAVPVALQGRDVLGSAQTGTGKTAAFGIPLVAHLIKNPQSAALVMTPTRELAVQVMQSLKSLSGHAIKSALLIGGENMFRQFSQLENDPRIIVGTPGRINDHLGRKSLRLGNADFLVLDETDRMLDMGFGVQIDKVLSYMPKERQTLMFSATLPGHIVSMSNKYMRQPERIAAGATGQPAKDIKQDIIRLTQAEKYETLTQQLDARGGSIIVFVRTKHGADRMARKLERESHNAAAIHGDLRQNKRDKVIRQFREKKIRILVATDVAARGLDVPHVEHVINYDLPQCPEDYIHRIGRTARAGASGEALCLITPEENGKWVAIERILGGNKNSNENNSEQRGPRQNNQNRPNKNNRFKKRKYGQNPWRDEQREEGAQQPRQHRKKWHGDKAESTPQPQQHRKKWRNDRAENAPQPQQHRKKWHGDKAENTPQQHQQHRKKKPHRKGQSWHGAQKKDGQPARQWTADSRMMRKS